MLVGAYGEKAVATAIRRLQALPIKPDSPVGWTVNYLQRGGYTQQDAAADAEAEWLALRYWRGQERRRGAA